MTTSNHTSTPSITEQTLADKIASFHAQLATAAPAEILGRLTREIEDIVKGGAGADAPRAGNKAPDFSLPDARGGEVSLAQALREGPVVLAFYRGQWCPYCDLELRAYQQVLPQIRALGGSLIAVSPQTPDNSLSTAEQRGLSFAVLSDAGNNVARRYGLVFKLSQGLDEIQRAFGIDLSKANGDGSNELPVPGTFIIARDGTIDFAFVNPDYRERLEPAQILRRLEGLKELKGDRPAQASPAAASSL